MRESRNNVRVAASCLVLLLVVPAFGSSVETPLPVNNYHLLLQETYPIETSVSFHASLLHWMDSLAGLSGAGLTAGKTQRAHRIEYSHVLGRPTDRDRTVLLGLPYWLESAGGSSYLFAALEFLDASEREEWISGMNVDIAAIARFLDTPELVQTERLAELLSDKMLSIRMGAYLAAALRLEGEVGAAADRARRSYLAEARSLAIPGELPFIAN